MAYISGNPVSIGDLTKKPQYDQVYDNSAFIHDSILNLAGDGSTRIGDGSGVDINTADLRMDSKAVLNNISIGAFAENQKIGINATALAHNAAGIRAYGDTNSGDVELWAGGPGANFEDRGDIGFFSGDSAAGTDKILARFRAFGTTPTGSYDLQLSSVNFGAITSGAATGPVTLIGGDRTNGGLQGGVGGLEFVGNISANATAGRIVLGSGGNQAFEIQAPGTPVTAGVPIMKVNDVGASAGLRVTFTGSTSGSGSPRFLVLGHPTAARPESMYRMTSGGRSFEIGYMGAGPIGAGTFPLVNFTDYSGDAWDARYHFGDLGTDSTGRIRIPRSNVANGLPTFSNPTNGDMCYGFSGGAGNNNRAFLFAGGAWRSFRML